MTNEEIIEVLHELDGSLYETQQAALDMAIKALEQQPCDDCVSRADLLKIYEDRFIELQKVHQQDKQLGINWCINTLKDMPPVTPTHGMCEDCKWWNSENNKIGYCNACKHGHCSSTWDIGIYRKTKDDFYCADYEKRGGENEVD